MSDKMIATVNSMRMTKPYKTQILLQLCRTPTISIDDLSKKTKIPIPILKQMPLPRLERDKLIYFDVNADPYIEVCLIEPDDPIEFQKAVKAKHKQFIDRGKK